MKIDGFNALGRLVQNAEKQVAQTVSAVENKVTHAIADTFEPASARQVQARTAGGDKNVPPMSTFRGTVEAGSAAPLTDAQKTARGALKIDPNGPPGKYDGMYVGADGWAYPPSRFKVSEVPPFQPAVPVATPTPTTYYVNGILTWPQDGNLAPDSAASGQANGEAQKIANKTGTNVVLIYNATSGNAAGDVAQTIEDRKGVGNNPAATTLANAIYADVKAGKKVNVEGYSQGGAIVSYALRQVDDRLANEQGWTSRLPILGDGASRERARLLGNVNVITFAGAGKDFPDGPKYTFYVNQQDPIPNYFGAHDFNPATDIPELIAEGIAPPLAFLNNGSPLFHAKDARVVTLNDPGTSSDVFAVNGKHGIDTYFGHIPDAS